MPMSDEPEKTNENETEDSFKAKIPGLGQSIIGELETIGGVLSGDPLTQAEGEFNVEVGTVREELEDDLEASREKETE